MAERAVMERSQFLQVMRFVAAALVLCTHATFYYHERVSATLPVWHFGEVGVPIFFVISGIVMIVASRDLPLNQAGAREFITKRLIRIVPLWWLALGIKVAVALARPEVVNHNHFELIPALKSFFFIPYFNDQKSVTPLHGVGWTLLHEMFFYLLFSASLLLGQRPAQLTSAVIIALWCAGMVWMPDSATWAVATSAQNLHFVLGMAVGLLLTRPQNGRVRGFAAAVALAASAVAAFGTATWQLDRVVMVVLLFAAMALMFADRSLPSFTTALGRLGNSSYALYLFHPFIAPGVILALVRLWPTLPAWAVLATTAAVTIAVSHALHLALEVPVVRKARAWLSPSVQTPWGSRSPTR